MAINYAGNKKYFKELIWKPAAIVGAIGLIACAIDPLIGGIGLVIAAGLIGMQVVGKSSAQSLDQQCQEAIAGIKEKALQKLGIDEDQVTEISPIFFDGYAFNNFEDPYFKKEGNRWRSSNYEAAAFFFSAEQVYCYKFILSLTQNSTKESTEEYFYKDIVAAATQSDIFSHKEGKNSISIKHEFFQLTTSGGTSISASFRDHVQAERSINGMKQLLRAKKSAN